MSIDGISINSLFKMIKDEVFTQECDVPEAEQAEAVQMTNYWQGLVSDFLAEQNKQNINNLSTIENIAPSSLLRRQARLRKKQQEKSSELSQKFIQGILDICLSQITTGISKIKKREAEKARLAAEISLLEATTSESKATQRKKGKRRKKPSPKPSEVTSVASTTTLKQEKGKEKETVATPIYSLAEKKQLFFANLSHQTSGWRQHSRVSRWKNSNLASIKLFSDRGLHHYKNKSNAQLKELRAKHYLPGTERLLNAPYANIYTCKTDSGFGMVAKFVYNGKSQAGMLYLGCDRKCIYHRFFEEVDFANKEDFFTESSDETVTANKNTTVALVTQSNEVQIEEKNGIIEFKYAGYSLFVYPIYSELLEQELA